MNQEIKALLLFISVIFTSLAVFDWMGNAKAYHGLLITAFILLLASNIIDLISSWHGERRKVDLDVKAPWMHQRQAD